MAQTVLGFIICREVDGALNPVGHYLRGLAYS